jgi:FecR protein
MRSHHSSPTTLLFLLSALLLISVAARADEDTTDDEYEEHARVLRVSLLKGEVSLQRAGGEEWEQAQLNAPLVEGDTLATGRDARLEIQADSRNFIRLGENSVVRVVTLRDEGIALSLSEGTATIRLAQFDRDKEYFEVDAPKTTVAAERTGQYRIDVDPQSVRITVRDEGRARIYSETSGFELHSDRAARLTYGDGADGDDWDVSAASSTDRWDDWNGERERDLASRLHYEGRERYYDPEVYGAEELDSYGDWQYTNDYGYVWRPSITVVNNYSDWAPYRYGHWDWCPPYGWTWIADEPWGWAPYHYGRWVYYNNYWAWAPRGYGYRYRHAWWRPALVAFVNVDFGNERRVCWYPLTYGQRDPRGRWWSRRFDPNSPQRAGGADRLPNANPWLRAVSSVREHEFGGTKVRALPAGVDIARRALTNEPVRGNLPFTRGDGQRVGGRDGQGRDGRVGAPDGRMKGANGREVLVINRPAPFMPPRAVPDRSTGATRRTPGVPLDEELRRTRLFNNRQLRVAPPSTADSASTNPGGGAMTGAIERPRSYRPTTPDAGNEPGEGRRERGGTRARGGEGGDATRALPKRSAPPSVNNPGEVNNPVEPSTGGEPHRRRTEPYDRGDSDSNRVRPVRPNGERRTVERPSGETLREAQPSSPPAYRPEPRERPAPPTERPSRREEPPSYRPERKAPSESRPSGEPPPRQEQPRQERPRQEAPRESRPTPPPARESGHPAKTERNESSSERKHP